jgi:DNA-binding NtrC family response regulator
VDDEKDIVNLFIEVLQENDYNIIGFTNPLSFLEYIHQHTDEFKLIILEYRMYPCKDVSSNEIAKINPKIKMILLTAYDNVTKNVLNLEIIKKPIIITRLLQIIEQHLD